jgi:hypothetical protein
MVATTVIGGSVFLPTMEGSPVAASDDTEFYIPKIGAFTCFSPAAARTFFPI